jgi:hypothetical protein
VHCSKYQQDLVVANFGRENRESVQKSGLMLIFSVMKFMMIRTKLLTKTEGMNMTLSQVLIIFAMVGENILHLISIPG